MQNRSCFTRKQTCNGEYTKHCTRSRHQLKMAAPAEVSEKRSNFRIRQFKEKRHFNIATNLTLKASFVILLIACTARIACSDRQTYRQTDRQTHTRDNYCNPPCACAPRVNNIIYIYVTVHAERKHKSAKKFPRIFADFALTDLFLRLYQICCG